MSPALEALNLCRELPSSVANEQKKDSLVNAIVVDEWEENDQTVRAVVATIHIAECQGNANLVKLLCESRTDVNNSTSQILASNVPKGLSPMYSAARNNRLDVLKMVLELSAQVDIRCSNGATPLILAMENGHREIAKVLIVNKASVVGRGATAVSAVYTAAKKGDMALLKLLVDNGGDVNASAANKSTPLHAAAQESHLEVVELLLAHKAEVNATNDDDDTPLMMAVYYNKVDVV